MNKTGGGTMSMLKTTTARARLRPEIKAGAEEILHNLGLSVSEAFDLYYRQIIFNNGLPFDVRIPNKATLKATLASRKGRGKKFKNINELFKDLGV